MVLLQREKATLISSIFLLEEGIKRHNATIHKFSLNFLTAESQNALLFCLK